MIASKAGTVVRGLRLTGKGHAAIDAAQRWTPDLLFDERQLTALTVAGYRVYLVRADRLLGVAA